MKTSFYSFFSFGLIATFMALNVTAMAQYTRQDTLRGSLSSVRSCIDVFYYSLDIKVDPSDSTIVGSNEIHFSNHTDFDSLQLDLYANLAIDSVVQNGRNIRFIREGNAFFVLFPETQKAWSNGMLTVYYHGKPVVAKRPPWDGGFVWEQDENGKPWVGVACEGAGASLWWPNKDHLSDEPDSMSINCTIPKGLTCVSNGNLVRQEDAGPGWHKFYWKVNYPINNYNITLNIADYTHIRDFYTNGQDSLPLDYYVLPYNIDKAIKHFKQVTPMLRCFERYFGSYPFWNDGYALVETTYWGMEHQGAVAYGNKYGKERNMYPPDGYDFDYIIIHETGHEWWGNNISCKDHAEMWIHESFCTYAEALYVECMEGYDRAIEYINFYKPYVRNKTPILADLGVNASGDPDMYLKGSLMLNTLRHMLDDDSLWFSIIYGLNVEFKHSTVTGKEVVDYISSKAGQDLQWFFDHYLKLSYLPILEYSMQKEGSGLKIRYRWKNTSDDFKMRVKVTLGKEKFKFIYPEQEWKETVIKKIREKDFKIALDRFYIAAEEVTPSP